MGTRNLVCVVLDKQFKVAQYGQWDGYLDGQGKTVIDFIANKMDLKKFIEALRECRWLTDAECDTLGAKPGWSKKHPELSRDTCADILALIQDGVIDLRPEDGKGMDKVPVKFKPPRGLVDSSSFAGDSLFCEYAYVLDMDKKVLEIYKGFNTKKAKGRFAKCKPDGPKYKPVTLWQKLSFKDCKAPDALDKLKAIEDAENKAREEAEAKAEKTA